MASYQLQLQQARDNFGIRQISGVCQDSQTLADYVNEVTQKLMKRGGWFGTEVLMRLCTNGCNIVFPRHVGTVLGLRQCGSNPIQIKNNWWAVIGTFGENSGWSQGYAGGPYGYGGGGYGYGASTYNVTGIDTTTVPIFNQISGNTGKFIRYHCVKNTDYGKKITIYGKQYGGQPLQTLVNGAWVSGIDITLVNPVSQTTTLVTKIDKVVREATEGMCYLYEFDPATSLLRMLAQYEPTETHPSYRNMVVPGLGCTPHSVDTDTGVSTYQFEALVKLQFIPADNDESFLLIDDMQALRYGILAMKNEEAGDIASAN